MVHPFHITEKGTKTTKQFLAYGSPLPQKVYIVEKFDSWQPKAAASVSKHVSINSALARREIY